MKKNYLLLIGMFSTLFVYGQTPEAAVLAKKFKAGELEHVDGIPVREGLSSRAIIYQNDFEDASEWIFNGPAGANPPNNGWSIGATTYGAGFPDGLMGTTGNFARFSNSDGAGNDISVGVVEAGPMTFELDSVFDLTGVCAPQVEFEQYGARFLTTQAVQVSVDGGTTWITAGTNDDIPPLTANSGDRYDRPMTRRFNLTSSIAGGEGTVRFRFFWDGGENGGEPNYIDYGWFVDNFRIVDGEDYDNEFQAGYFRSGVGSIANAGLAYYVFAEDQVAEIQLSSQITNQGCQTHTGTIAKYEVSGPSTFSGTSAAVDLAASAKDSLFATTNFTPSGTGTYTINYSFEATNTDGITTNDQGSDRFEVHPYLFSRSNGVQQGAITNTINNSNEAMGIGNIMEIFNDGTIGALDVYVGEPEDAFDGQIYAEIYKWNGNAWEWHRRSEDVTLSSSDFNKQVTIFFDNPASVAAGEFILAMAGHYAAPEFPFGMAQSVEEGTVLGTSGDGTIFALASPGVIMLNLHMRSYVGINENSVSNLVIEQNVPNPFNDAATINYTLTSAADIKFELSDLSGKMIEVRNVGLQNAGKHQIVLDGTKLQTGTYFYTFKIGEEKITKRMTVTH